MLIKGIVGHTRTGEQTGIQGDNRQTNREWRENKGLNTQGVIMRHTEKGQENKQRQEVGSKTWQDSRIFNMEQEITEPKKHKSGQS